MFYNKYFTRCKMTDRERIVSTEESNRKFVFIISNKKNRKKSNLKCMLVSQICNICKRVVRIHVVTCTKRCQFLAYSKLYFIFQP